MKNILKYWESVSASLKIIGKIQPRLILAVSIKSLLQAVQPFVMIIVSSRVITMIAADVSVNEIISYAATGLFISFLLMAARGVLEKFCTVRFDDCWRR